MKKIIPVVFVVLGMLSGCKKNTPAAPPPKKWLNKILVNGLQTYEYTFSSDGRLLLKLDYIINAGTITPSTMWLYTYNSERTLSGWKNLSDDDTLYSHTLCTYDLNKRIAKYEEFTPGSTLYKTTLLEYSRGNLVAKQTIRLVSTGTVLATHTFTYDDKGRLEKHVFYLDKELNGKLLLSAEISYLHQDNQQVYDHWKPFVVLPTDLYLDELTMASRKYRYYDENEELITEIDEITSGKEYDEVGMLVKQTITRKNIKPVKPDEVNKFVYTYTK